MAIKLIKGQGINLRKEAPNLKRVLIGLGWDPIKSSGFSFFKSNINMDIDASIICINEEGRYDSIVYYRNLKHRSGAIKHYGDNLTGEGDGDDEQIEIDLDKIPKHIQRLAVIINIYKAYNRNQDFGKVRNCFVHATDLDTNKELVSYDITDNYDGKTGIFVADIYRYNGEWKFKAIGQGVKVADIQEMIDIKCSNN